MTALLFIGMCSFESVYKLIDWLIDRLIDWCDVELNCVSKSHIASSFQCLAFSHGKIAFKLKRTLCRKSIPKCIHLFMGHDFSTNFKPPHFPWHLAITNFTLIKRLLVTFSLTLSLSLCLSISISLENGGNWFGFDNLYAYLLLIFLDVPFKPQIGFILFTTFASELGPKINLLQFISCLQLSHSPFYDIERHLNTFQNDHANTLR